MNPLPQVIVQPAIGAEQRLEIRAGDVAAKEIDGEILVMNVGNGMYYSLDGVGAVTWRLLVAGHSLGEVAAALAESFDVDPVVAYDDVTDLAIRLMDEALVSVSVEPGPVSAADVAVSESAFEYRAPRLNSYSDMADLLALDPPMPGLAETNFIADQEV